LIKIEKVEWQPEKPEVVNVSYRYTVEVDGGEVEEASSVEVTLGENVQNRIRQTVKAEVLKRRQQEWISQAEAVEGEDLENWSPEGA